MDKIICPVCKNGADVLMCRICKGTGFVKPKIRSEYKKKRNDILRKRAYRARAFYTANEIELIKDSQYSISYLAKKLGRSLKAIETVRNRIKREERRREEEKSTINNSN